MPLRPLGVIEMLDGAIQTVRRHPLPTLGLAAAVSAVVTLLNVLVTVWLLPDESTLSDEPTTDEVVDFLGGAASTLGVTLVFSLIAQVVLTGMLTVVVGRAVLGRSVDIGTAWREARGRLPALLGIALAVPVASFLLFVLAVGVGLLVGWATVGALGVLLGVLLGIGAVVAVFWLLAVTAVAGPAAVLERDGIVTAFRRSYRLVSGTFWRVLGIWLLIQLLASIVAGVFAVPGVVTGEVVSSALDDDGTGLVPQLIVGVWDVLGSTVAYPVVAAATALLYMDLRMRKEGLDIELTRAAGLGPTGTSATPGTPGMPGTPGAPAGPGSAGGPGPGGPAGTSAGPGAPPQW
ncbi:hypothetical protein [Motilibacter deserti]|uniref:DUF7847 domain-containing protein n=1 Tax=Motilibacter deserti TaxID=2714956 RepID=A0ABX0GTK6_9ACTN|nr:hypothetical protein [Motilibacter deserti]NHC13036.1 hypothetical protein [Motilibacter deserti]